MVHKHRFLSMIKQVIQKQSQSFFESFFNSETIKPYSFSVTYENQQSKDEVVSFTNKSKMSYRVNYLNQKRKAYLTISSIDEKFIMLLMQGFNKLKFYNLSNCGAFLVNDLPIMIKINKVQLQNQKEIDSSFALFKTETEILLEDKNRQPILFNELESLNLSINHLTSIAFQQCLGRSQKEPLYLIPARMKKQVVDHFVSGFADSMPDKILMKLTGNKGSFALKGNPDDLNIIRDIGIGRRTGQGFGMIREIW